MIPVHDHDLQRKAPPSGKQVDQFREKSDQVPQSAWIQVLDVSSVDWEQYVRFSGIRQPFESRSTWPHYARLPGTLRCRETGRRESLGQLPRVASAVRAASFKWRSVCPSPRRRRLIELADSSQSRDHLAQWTNYRPRVDCHLRDLTATVTATRAEIGVQFITVRTPAVLQVKETTRDGRQRTPSRLIRDQEVGGSNPLAPTNYPSCFH